MTVVDLIIAVRGGPNAKSRAGGSLPPSARADLVEAMLADMLEAASAARHVRCVWVVTPTAELATLAAGMGAEVVREPAPMGVNAAFELGRAAQAQRPGAAASILAPGDLPLVRGLDLDRLAALHAPRRVVVCPATVDGGTGAILVPSDRPFPLAFGPDSFRRHVDAAERADLELRVLIDERFGADLDTTTDLPARVASHLAARTAACLKTWGVGQGTET